VQGAHEPVRADLDTLAEAVRVHRPWLVRRLALVVGDAEEAEDLAQRVFLRAAERWPFPPEQDVAPGLRWSASDWPSTSDGDGGVGGSSRSGKRIRNGR